MFGALNDPIRFASLNELRKTAIERAHEATRDTENNEESNKSDRPDRQTDRQAAHPVVP